MVSLSHNELWFHILIEGLKLYSRWFSWHPFHIYIFKTSYFLEQCECKGYCYDHCYSHDFNQKFVIKPTCFQPEVRHLEKKINHMISTRSLYSCLCDFSTRLDFSTNPDDISYTEIPIIIRTLISSSLVIRKGERGKHGSILRNPVVIWKILLNHIKLFVFKYQFK